MDATPRSVCMVSALYGSAAVQETRRYHSCNRINRIRTPEVQRDVHYGTYSLTFRLSRLTRDSAVALRRCVSPSCVTVIMYRSRHVSRLSQHDDVDLDEQDVCYPAMRNFLSRLRSFPSHFPPSHFTVSRASLAHEGFFFHPSNSPPPHATDKTACYACGLELSRWQPTDQADKEHRRMAGSGCPLIEARDRRRRGSGAAETAAGGGREGRSSSGRLRAAKAAAGSGSTAAAADEGGNDGESQSRRESDARMVAAVWNGGRTQLSELRAVQRKKRKQEVIEQLTGGKRARTAAVTAATPVAVSTASVGANRSDVLRALFMQEVLMAVITPR